MCKRRGCLVGDRGRGVFPACLSGPFQVDGDLLGKRIRLTGLGAERAWLVTAQRCKHAGAGQRRWCFLESRYCERLNVSRSVAELAQPSGQCAVVSGREQGRREYQVRHAFPDGLQCTADRINQPQFSLYT